MEYNPKLLRKQPIARILCVGDDAILLNSRQLVLSNAGYDVRSCTSARAVQLCRSASFDIALVYRSVSDEQSALLTQVLRVRCPTLRIVRLKPTSIPELDLYDFAIDTARGPVNFIHDIRGFVTGSGIGNHANAD